MPLPLRRRILIYSSTLLVALIAAMLVFVNYQAQRFVNERIGTELEQGIQRLNAGVNERLDDLQLTARLVASFPALKALLATDFATIRDFLNSYLQENKRAESLIVFDPTGRVVARTDTPSLAPIPEVKARWVEPALSAPAESAGSTQRAFTSGIGASEGVSVRATTRPVGSNTIRDSARLFSCR